MKKILFPTDFSEAAHNAFVHALELAKVVHGEVILLHTFEIPIVDNTFFPVNYPEIIESIELAKFDQFKDEIPKLRAMAKERNLEYIKMSHRLMDGDLIHNIQKITVDESIDFVVMGTQGATGWTAVFVGTHTGATIASSTVPVMCVPFDAKFNPVETIGFTTRFREKDKDALKKVIGMAKQMHAKVKCLYVVDQNTDVSEETIATWKNEFSQDAVQFFVTPDEDVKKTILDFITSQEIDVLAMLTYKRNFFVALFETHFTEKMAYNSPIPILALHE